MADKGKSTRRPAFQSVEKPATYEAPEDVFSKLTGRAGSHAYLRGPQQDVLRDYMQHAAEPDVAFELPTGTGKTAVGLIVAEWHRLAGRRVAYLSLTNQLAGQVFDEGERLSIPCADLRGKKDERNAAEEGRFKMRSAVGVSTYSNLFNVNPVIRECDLLVLDDAHGAEHHVADMWTVTVRMSDEATLFNSMLADLRPGMTESQLSAVLDPAGFRTVEMVDALGHSESLAAVTATLDNAAADGSPTRYAWRAIRNRLPVCLFLVSASEITIRPIIPPTHTHPPFGGAAQRIYMSATLGGESDLRRAYGIEKVQVVRAKTQQWGRRYVFVPGVYMNGEHADTLVASVWDAMAPRRAVLLSPSERALNRAYAATTKSMAVTPERFDAMDIQDTVDNFVQHERAILALASRYDGLDLPGDQCRLLVMAESPAATNPLERHLIDRWKLGPVLRQRERTRLIQGMGRCTRNATDFAVIIWLGQSLVNAATSQPLLAGMPAEIAAEIRWGLTQVEADPGVDAIASMIGGLLEDAEYRKGANASIAASVAPEPPEEPPKDYEKIGADEVRFARTMWDEDYSRAFELARTIADHINAQTLSGYRAWWWYLASTAAALIKNADNERDALQRSAACGVNCGWIRRLLMHRSAGAAAPKGDDEFELNAEAVWDLLERWGWAGPAFAANRDKMLDQLKEQYHGSYHEGLETLGKCLGATTLRTTEQGAPDVVWSFAGDVHFAFEAKTEKKDGGALSKKNLLEAKGHVEWVQAKVADNPDTAVIEPVVISPEPTVHEVGLPFTGGLFHVRPEEILSLAKEVADQVTKLRIKYSGRDYSSSRAELSVDIRALHLDVKSTAMSLTKAPLKG